MVTALFSASTERWDAFKGPLEQAFEAHGLQVNLVLEATPGEVDYIVCAPNGPVQDFSPFTKLKAVLNLWAGVEGLVDNATLNVPLCRMVDSGLSEGMAEWVTGHVLRLHLGMDTHILGQDGVWRAGRIPPLARDRSVGILGLGALGQACAQALCALNFPVSGWSRSPKSVDGVTCYSGDTGFEQLLCVADILVLLLPLTPATHHILDATALKALPKGAMIVNPGRGPLIDDAALLAALDVGQIGQATLDVFATEPLPPEHPFWAHPRVTVTPHIASETRPSTASQVIAENIRRGEVGELLLHVVDRNAGY
ncbi:MAG: glyoxylate/hydroxypyruvate reductase A [Pseudomonadota bacterium]